MHLREPDNHGVVDDAQIGAGRRGFLMFLCQEASRVREVMADQGLEDVRFRFDFEGTKVILP